MDHSICSLVFGLAWMATLFSGPLNIVLQSQLIVYTCLLVSGDVNTWVQSTHSAHKPSEEVAAMFWTTRAHLLGHSWLGVTKPWTDQEPGPDLVMANAQWWIMNYFPRDSLVLHTNKHLVGPCL
jgi:succinate dehydrogenase hydrophobic anchor subunit